MLSPETWNRFVDDAGPLEDDVRRRASPSRGDRVVDDTDLPRLAGFRGDVRLVITGGAGQVAGPLGLARRMGVEVSALDLTVRDLDDPLGNVRRLVAACDEAMAAGDLLEDTVVHLRTPGGPLTPRWLAALDVVAEVEWVLALPLDGARGADLEAWIDAAMDRETAVSLVGGSVEQAVAGLRTAARLWGDEPDLRAARRWVRSWASTDADTALEALEALGSTP